MADWTGARYDAGWTFRRIEWGTWRELGEYDDISDAKFSRSAFDTLKLSGSLNYLGEPPDEIDAVSATYSFRDSAGETVEHLAATFLVEAEEPTYASLATGGYQKSGSAKFYSLLKVLSDTKCKVPYTVKAGTNAVGAARRIVEAAGLRTNGPASDYTLSADHTFAAADSMLTVVNWLLDAAGYASADTDAAGTVLLVPYVEPTSRATVWTFANDETSTISPGLDGENDWRSAPNVVVCNYEVDDEFLSAVAKNIDPDSRASLPSRNGRESSVVEEVSELDGDTQTERLENLKALAKKKLLDNSSEIQYTKLETLFVPIDINSAAEVMYSGLERRGAVTSMDVTCDPSGTTSLKLREFIRRDMLIDVTASAA